MTYIPTTIKNQALVEQRREQIVLAAIKLFSRKGFHKTNLRELASEAGISTGNIYDYVGAKEDILFLIHSYVSTIVVGKLDKCVIHVADPIEKLRRMVRTELEVMDQLADAILLLYQEASALGGDYLHLLLSKEREHVGKFEMVLEEVMKAGQLQDCNIRMAANLIKTMIDSWVIKRWDLKEHVSRQEAENTILGLLFNGLLRDTEGVVSGDEGDVDLAGKTVFLANAESPLSKVIAKAYLKRGARVVIYSDNQSQDSHYLDISSKYRDNVLFVSLESGNCSPLTLLDKIEACFGPLDVYLHDFTIGNLQDSTGQQGAAGTSELQRAIDFAPYIVEKMSANSSGRIIYVSPWAGGLAAGRLLTATITGSIAALTRDLSRQLAPFGANVNCVIPGHIQTARSPLMEENFSVDSSTQITRGQTEELQDVVDAVLFLSGDSSRYITGQDIRVNGGQPLRSVGA